MVNCRIRKYLIVGNTKILVHAFVTCRLDNGNALLYGLPNLLQNFKLFWTVLPVWFYANRNISHATPLSIQLHWLPVSHIIFKILLLRFKELNGLAPMYITELLDRYVPSRPLRSSSRGLLKVPRSHAKYGDRSFSKSFPVCAPTLWNSLPDHLGLATDL